MINAVPSKKRGNGSCFEIQRSKLIYLIAKVDDIVSDIDQWLILSTLCTEVVVWMTLESEDEGLLLPSMCKKRHQCHIEFRGHLFLIEYRVTNFLLYY